MSSQLTFLQRALRAFLRFVYPEYPAHQEQMQLLTDTLRSVDERLHQIKQTAADRDAVAALGQQLAKVRGQVDRHGRVLLRTMRRGDARSEGTRDERLVMQRLERIAAGGQPIVVGPWSGEVGFELLYWVPFVAWFQRHFDVDPRRLTVVSRGGVDSWYAHAAAHYADAFSFMSVDAFRTATEQANKKQRAPTAFDLRLLRQVVAARRLGRVRVLHPSLMYRMFWAYFKHVAPAPHVKRYAAFQPLGGNDAADLPPALPRDYVAVRFYFSQCFPDTPANRAFVAGVVDGLAAAGDVVLLNTPFSVDDHVDYTVAAARVHTIGRMPPERNLAIQTAVIRRARAFVGTYGGYSYLAPFYGVPSTAFYSERTYFQHHLDLAQRVFNDLGAPSLVPLDVRDVDLLRAALQRTGAAPAAGSR